MSDTKPTLAQQIDAAGHGHLLTTNATVSRAVQRGSDAISLIAILANQTDRLTQRLLYLEAVCPFKIRTADGRELIWRCPDDRVPLVTMENIQPPTPPTT